MTTTLTAPDARPIIPQPKKHSARHTFSASETQTWILRIEGMAGRVRGIVEKQMLLLPEGEPGDAWFTRWCRRPDRTYSCAETIRATPAQLAPFREAIARAAEQYNFVATITKRTYDGPHV